MPKSTRKHRSPRFPFITLEKALEYLPPITELKTNNKLTRENIVEAMGFESFSGPAARSFGALRAYHLIEGTKDEPTLTEVGEALANDSTDLKSLQVAALSPLAFRGIWRRARNASEEELVELLIAREFTEDGARRAAATYRTNAVAAQLDELTVEPNLPDRRGSNPPLRKIEERLRKKLLASSQAANLNTLKLPVSTGNVIIPRGISEEEFQLILDTLKIWKSQLVSQPG